MPSFGIEKIGVYPSSLKLEIDALCAARGLDRQQIADRLMVNSRTVMPPWEDTVTMAVNATHGLLTADELQSIELLIVATESSVDQEKPISSWAQHWLGLPSYCRNFEIKHACYGGTVAVRMALAWLKDQPAGRPVRALVLGADASLDAIDQPHEPAMGACGFALLLSNQPDFLELESTPFGVFAQNVTDVIRPNLTVETGNSETSLFAYLDAIEGTLNDFNRRTNFQFDLMHDVRAHIYHLPFAGMGLQAHRCLASLAFNMSRKEATEHFKARVWPSLEHSSRIGSGYSSSTFVALLSLLDYDASIANGDRISIFSYGSGSCAELYVARFGKSARSLAANLGLAAILDARQSISVAEYEKCERTRIAAMGKADVSPDYHLVDGCYEKYYRGTGRLVLDSVVNYERNYRRA